MPVSFNERLLAKERMEQLKLLYLIFALCNFQLSRSISPKNISILLLLSFEIEDSTSEQPWFIDGPMIVPVAEIAAEQINERDDLLPGYFLNLIVANSACNLLDYTAVNFVASFFHSDVNFVGIVGPTCSDSVGLVSAFTGKRAISILNFHSATSPRFTDRSKYRYSFGVAGSHSSVGLFLHLMQERKWNNVAVLYEETIVLFLTAYDLLVQQLPQIFPQGKISFSAPVSHGGIPLSSIIDQHIRVVLVLSTSSLARKILCLIKKLYHQLIFPAYQFIFVGVHFSYVLKSIEFTLNHKLYTCSVEEITQVMEGFLLTHLKLDPANNVTEMVSGISYVNFLQQYQQRVNGSTTGRANPIYDGVWSLVLALNNSLPKLNGIGLDLLDYTYGRHEATEIILEEVMQLNFTGASGHILYNRETGYTLVSINLHQVVNNDSVLIGYYSEEIQKLLFVQDAHFVESYFKLVELVVHPALAGVIVLIGIVAAVLIIIAQALTLYYRDFHAIRASSYRLGQLAFVGCYTILICFFSFTAQKLATTATVNTTLLCVIQAWSLPIGLTLILGTVTAKTWRLYQIFIHLRRPGQLLQDWVLVTGVISLTAVDVTLCLVWTAKFNISTKNQTYTEDNMLNMKIECTSEYYHIWFGALCLYQASIMASALILALITRNIHHDHFKTKSVTFIVYLLIIVISLGFPLYFIISTQQPTTYGVNIEYILLSVTYLCIIFSCFSLLFLPPILSLIRVKLVHKIPALSMFSKKVKSKSYSPGSFLYQ